MDKKMGLSIVDTAWLAGILEGEGSFIWNNKGGNVYGCPYLRIGMTDEDIVKRVQSMIGGRIRIESARQKGWKDQFRLAISGQPAIEVMKKILPFMGERRSIKISQLIDKWESRPNRKQGHRNIHAKLTSSQVIQIRERYAVGNISQRALAQEYGVTNGAINFVVHGRTWKDVGGPIMP